jgi:hypothetical protein
MTIRLVHQMFNLTQVFLMPGIESRVALLPLTTKRNITHSGLPD